MPVSSLRCGYIASWSFQQLKVFHNVYFYTSEHKNLPAVTSPKVCSNVLFPAAIEAEDFLIATLKSFTLIACSLLHSVTFMTTFVAVSHF